MNKTQTEDRIEDVRELVQNELTDQKLQHEANQSIRYGLADGSTSFMDQELEQENMK